MTVLILVCVFFSKRLPEVASMYECHVLLLYLAFKIFLAHHCPR